MAISRSIDELLESYAHDALIDIGDATNIAPRQKKKMLKRDLIALLKQKLFTSARVVASYALLGENDRQVLNYLLFRGGQVDRARLERDLLRAGLVTPTERKPDSRYQDAPLYAPEERMAKTAGNSRAFQDVMARLTLQGLVFSTPTIYESTYTYKLGLHPASYIFVPGEIGKHLPKFSESPITIADWKPVRTERKMPHLLLRDLYLYWDFVLRSDVTLTRSGAIGKRQLRALNDVLLVPDPDAQDASNDATLPRLGLLRSLLLMLDLIDVRGVKMTAKMAAGGGLPDFWKADLPQQSTALVRALLEQIKPATVQTYRYGGYDHVWETDQLRAWKTLLNVLLDGGGRWFDVASLTDEARQKDRSFLVPKFDSLKSMRYVQIAFKGQYYYDPQKLTDAVELAEETASLELCNNLLIPFGLAECGFLQMEDTDWRLIRLTGIGRTAAAEILGKAAPARTAESGVGYATPGAPTAEMDEGRVIVQPNFQVLAIGPVPTRILVKLQLCAVRTKTDAHVFEYSLTRDSVYQAEKVDFPVNAVIDFLQEISGAPLPQNVLRSLQEWGAHHERIVFRTNVNLLQTADAATLERLLTDPAISPQLARGIAPTVALVADNSQDKLLGALFSQNILPAFSAADPSQTDNDVIVQPDGIVTPVHGVPNLFLTGRLARIAEQDEQGGWRITPETVRRQGHGREATQAVLNELGRLHRGALPTAVVVNVKRWGGYYGRVAVGAVTLLEFDSKAHLEDARTHPRLHALLTPFDAGDRALAMVDAAHLAEAEKILAELGVELTMLAEIAHRAPDRAAA